MGFVGNLSPRINYESFEMQRQPVMCMKKKRSGSSISIGLPGFSRDEIHVAVEKNSISVAAEKKQRKVERRKGFYREVAFRRAFKRSMLLPEGVSPDKLEIKVEDGVVKIKRKKKKAA